ncbi:MAG: Rrf2 family transcriptional regulator [Myxococcota bacterium]
MAREETGLRCLLRVALEGSQGSPVPNARIAAQEGISGVYAAKLMRQLRLAGLVESTRGAAGGYQLARPAEAITVWDAIRALDHSFLPTVQCECAPDDRNDCRRTTGCAISSLWRRLGSQIKGQLTAMTLAELCGPSLDSPMTVSLPVAGNTPSPSQRESLRTKNSTTSTTETMMERAATWPYST